jgi:hypothetical protein
MEQLTRNRILALLVGAPTLCVALSWWPTASDLVRFLSIVGVALVAGISLSRALLREAPIAWALAGVGWLVLNLVITACEKAASLRLVAVLLVALGLYAASRTPRGAVWGRVGVLLGGVAAGLTILVNLVFARLGVSLQIAPGMLLPTAALLGLAVLPTVGWRIQLRVAATVVMAVGVVASHEIAPLLGALVLGAVWFFDRSANQARLLATVLTAIMTVGLVAQAVGSIRAGETVVNLAAWRVDLATALAEQPFGAGPGEFADASIAHVTPQPYGVLQSWYVASPRATSDIVHLVAVLGLPGLVLLAGFVVSSVMIAGRASLAPWALVASFVIASCIGTVFVDENVLWIGVLGLGSLLPSSAGGPAGRVSRGAFVVAIALGLLSAVAVVRPSVLLGPSARGLRERALALVESSPGEAELGEAARLVRDAVRARPRSWQDRALLGKVLFERARLSRDLDTAIEAAGTLEQATKQNQLDVLLLVDSAEAWHLARQLDRAREAFTRALQREPHCHRAHLGLALVSIELGDYRAACDTLRVAEESMTLVAARGRLSPDEKVITFADPLILDRLRSACATPSQ